MNVILVSNRWVNSRSLELAGRHIAMLVLALTGLVILSAIGLQYALVHLAPESVSRALSVGGILEEQAGQKAFQRNSLDTLALKLGEMQARVQRLDALGGRLVQITGMKPSEFQFDKPPAQGGPLVLLPNSGMTVASLTQQLNTLGYLVDDRADKLMALETLLMQNKLNKALLPSTAPVSDGFYTSNFGWRTDPFTGHNAMHEGVDFMALEGTPIRASAGGVVVFADTHPQYGNMVEIDHGKDIVTRYAHASKLLVKVGQVVRRGEEIAKVGSTGRSTGNHLHFEVRYKGSAQNPVRFLQNPAG